MAEEMMKKDDELVISGGMETEDILLDLDAEMMPEESDDTEILEDADARKSEGSDDMEILDDFGAEEISAGSGDEEPSKEADAEEEPEEADDLEILEEADASEEPDDAGVPDEADDEEADPEAGVASEIERVRSALEEARDEENTAYHALQKITLTDRQREVIKLMKLKEAETMDPELADERFRMLLNHYCLPRIVKDGSTFQVADSFTRFDEPERDYLEVVFTKPSGKKRTAGYNYKFDSDNRSLIIFEKTFENKILEPGEPEKYVIQGDDGEEIASYSAADLKDLIAGQEAVKVDDKYYLKAKDEDGNIIDGVTDVFTKEGFENGCKTVFGDNEQTVYSVNKNGQLLKAIKNDVKTTYVEKKTLPRSEAVYWNEQEARAAAESMLGENDTNRSIEIFAEGTSSAKFNFIPMFTTIIDLKGTIRKVGKGMGEYDPELPDDENVKNQMAKLISDYLDEKGYHVVNISCDNIAADVKESVGWMNTVKTYQMTAGTVSVTYVKVYKTSVTLKQGFLHGQKSGNTDAILAQLPAGSELLDPEGIDWKSSKPTVTYYARAEATASGSGKTVDLADDVAMDNVILEAQRIAARGLNGAIPSGMRESIAANGAVSTVTNVRKKIDVPTVTKNDMEISRQIAKYAFGGTFEREVTSTSNQLVAVTTWDAKPLVYVEPTDPIVEKGIPADDNYDRFVNEDDDSGILLFEKTDIEFRRFIQDAMGAQELTATLAEDYDKARKKLVEAQKAFDQVFDSL